MKVPLLDLKQQNIEVADELTTAFQRVLYSGRYILGEEVERLEENAAAVAGTKHAIGVSSGTDAILLALMSLDIGPGAEVLCPAFTFFATAGCVARVGARPVFVDSCPVCFNIDAADIERRITPRTQAIIPVHLFGQAAGMEEIMALASRHGLPVIEDAAQALGAAYNAHPVGCIGTFGTFSFFPSKNLGGLGDAGLLVTNDDALAQKARLLRVHGAFPKYIHKMIGGNFRMGALEAALLSVKLPLLESYIARRTENACYYTRQLREIEGINVAQGPCGAAHNVQNAGKVTMVLPHPHAGRRHIWNQYTIRVIAGAGWNRAETPRDVLREFLAGRGVASEIYYPRPLHLQECFHAYGPYPPLPICEGLAAEALSLPIYPELNGEQLDIVTHALADFLREIRR